MKIANATLLKKLKVAVDIEIGRQYGCRHKYRSPSINSRRTEGDSAVLSGTSSRRRIAKMKNADQT